MFKRVIFSVLTLSLIGSSSAHAAKYDEVFYSSNDILFYNPETATCSGDSAGSETVIVGGNNLEKIFNFFRSKGLSPEQSAGIVGNISQESGGNPHRRQGGPDIDTPVGIKGPVGGGNAWGLIQWDAGYRAIEYAKKANITTPIGDLSTQLELIWWHMNNESPTGARNLVEGLKKTTTVQEATEYYEKNMTGAGTPMMTKRIVAATVALERYGGNTPTSETSVCMGNSSSGIISGGMSLEQATLFMNTYKGSENSVDYIGGAGRGCTGGPLSNCVSFSVYFINKYTNLKGFMTGAPGNGKDVVNNIKSRNSDVKLGKQPQPYAIFSTPGPSSAGHTGVILGVDTEKKTIVIGEANCNGPSSTDRAYEFTFDEWNKRTSRFGGSIQYAYTDGFLKEGNIE